MADNQNDGYSPSHEGEQATLHTIQQWRARHCAHLQTLIALVRTPDEQCQALQIVLEMEIETNDTFNKLGHLAQLEALRAYASGKASGLDALARTISGEPEPPPPTMH